MGGKIGGEAKTEAEAKADGGEKWQKVGASG